MNAIILTDRENVIFKLRDTNVMMDVDLAEMYGITVAELRKAVNQNPERFPEDFLFTLTKDEKTLLSRHVSRFRELSKGRIKPYAFTESGISMLSAVIDSEKAIQISVSIMRTFGHYRSILNDQVDVKSQVQELDVKFTQAFQFLLQRIDSLQNPPETPLEPIGFRMGGIS